MEIPIKYVWFSLKSILIGHLNHSNRIRNEQVMTKILNLLKQENQNRLYRYKSNMYWYKLVKNDQNRSCTGTSSNCTGTSLRKVPRRCIFSHFSCTFPSQTKSMLHIHFKIISNTSCNLNYTQIIFQWISFFQIRS